MTLKQLKIKLCRGALFFVKAMFTVFVLTTMLTVGPILEGKLYPVVSPTSNAQVNYKDDYMIVSFSGEKNRVCDIKNVSALSKVNGVFVQAKIKFLEMGEEAETPAPRPVGLQYFGPWKIEPQGTAILILSHHQCHPLWTTESLLVNWDSDNK